MLENLSKAEKTKIIAYFPIKIWVKKFHLVVGALGQLTWAKIAWNLPTYDVTHTKPQI